MTCPHCRKKLTAEQIRSIWGAFCASLELVRSIRRERERIKELRASGRKVFAQIQAQNEIAFPWMKGD
jgi:hypothetical protein